MDPAPFVGVDVDVPELVWLAAVLELRVLFSVDAAEVTEVTVGDAEVVPVVTADVPEVTGDAEAGVDLSVAVEALAEAVEVVRVIPQAASTSKVNCISMSPH